MVTAKQVYKLLPPAKNVDTLTIRNQTTNDIVNQVLSQHQSNVKQAKQIAHLFDGGNAYNTCQNVWNFLKYQIPYRIEPSSKQTTKSLSRIIYDSFNGGSNDCKHYSGFAGAVLSALNYPFKYRFTGYSNYSKTPTHVYVVCQPKIGSEIYVDAVLNDFDVQKPYKLKIDKKMSLYQLSGVDEVSIGAKRKKPTKLISTIKKAGKNVVKAATAVKQAAATYSLVAPRNAFLLLLKYNVHGWATGLKNNSFESLKWWKDWFGGDRTVLMNTIKEGAKRKRILGLDNDSFLVPESVGMIGLEPVSVSATIAQASPIMIKVASILKTAEEAYNKIEKIKAKADETKKTIDKGRETFKNITGKDVTDLILKKDEGKTSNQINVDKNDLKTPTDAEALKVANAIVNPTKKTGLSTPLLIGGAAAAALLLITLNKKR